MNQPQEQNSQRILIVDDDEHLLELLTIRLNLAGYSTYTAKDGLQALRRVHEVQPEGMVLDINMPRVDGFEVLDALARSRRLSNIPVLVLTARNRPEDVKMAVQLGAKDYLTKPFEDRQLLRRIARLTRRSGKRPPEALPSSFYLDEAED
jgi:two-component system OmpR family response regulator